MRLTTTDAGFVDATPIKPGKLVDFILLNPLETAVDMIEAFWVDNRTIPQRAGLLAAAIHALYLAQGPRLLEYERFIYSYIALDACFALTTDLHPPPPRKKPNHATRVQWMCNKFGMPTPDWAEPALKSSSPIATIRNATIHEALYLGKPLGFAVGYVDSSAVSPGHDSGVLINSGMQNLICRLLVTILGARNSDYVKIEINTRATHGLALS